MTPEEIPLPQDPAWETYAPLLDEALAGLGKKAHDAVALRYFRGLNLRDIGTALGISEEAARKRVDRGIVRLRQAMTAKATVPAVAVLTAQLAARGSEAAPAHLVQSIAASAGAAAAKGTFIGAIAQKASHAMTWVKIKFAATIIAAIGVAGAGTGTLVTLAQEGEAPPPKAAAVAPPATVPSAQSEQNGPTLITLHVTDADARDVLQQIARQANVRIALWPDWCWSGTSGSKKYRVTMNLDNIPFWTAIDQLCAATKSRLIVSGSDRRSLSITEGTQRGMDFSGIKYQSGPFTVVANQITHTRTSNLVDGSTDPSDMLSMNVYLDPRFTLLKCASIAVLDLAQDDNGVSMLPANAPLSALFRPPFTDWDCQLHAYLKYPPHPGKRLSRVTGHFDAELVQRTTPLTIDDVAHSIGKGISYEDYTMTLDSYSSINGNGSIRVTISKKRSGSIWGAADDGLEAEKVDDAISLVNGDGETICSMGSGSGDANERHAGVNFMFGRIKEPVKLVWNFPEEIKTETVHFEFKDLPLPQE
jgi:hypothetical protein